MKLFEYDNRIDAVLSMGTNRDTGEISEECLAELDALGMGKDDKCLSTAAVIKGMRAEGEAVERTANELLKRAKIHFNQADRLEGYLAANFDIDHAPLSDARSQIAWRKNPPSVSIPDLEKVPARYQRVIPEKREPDKKAIKDALNTGVKMSFASLHQTQRLEVK